MTQEKEDDERKEMLVRFCFSSFLTIFFHVKLWHNCVVSCTIFHQHFITPCNCNIPYQKLSSLCICTLGVVSVPVAQRVNPAGAAVELRPGRRLLLQ